MYSCVRSRRISSFRICLFRYVLPLSSVGQRLHPTRSGLRNNNYSFLVPDETEHMLQRENVSSITIFVLHALYPARYPVRRVIWEAQPGSGIRATLKSGYTGWYPCDVRNEESSIHRSGDWTPFIPL